MTTSNQQRENRIARHRSNGSDVYAGDAVDVTGRSYQCKRQHHATYQTTDPTRVGMLRLFRARAVRYGGCPIHVNGAC